MSNSILAPKLSLKAPLELAKRASDTQAEHEYRNHFMRDRDRVLYSKAFRRLSGKTQVYLSGIDDHKRTRLTHTLEVSQIARSISHVLRLDPDLTEAIALGHDIGHTPFGHVGERTLHTIMTPNIIHELGEECPLCIKDDKELCNFISAYSAHLGFKHNLQSLKCTMKLEKNYDSNGLDLTNFTLFGMYLHSSSTFNEKQITNHDQLHYYDQYINKACKITQYKAWSFEAFVVAQADEIAQFHHDVEDAIRGNIISKSEIASIILECFKNYITTNAEKEIQNALVKDDETFITIISRILINMFVTKLINSSTINMNSLINNEKLTDNNFADFISRNTHEEKNIKNIVCYSVIDNDCGFQKATKLFQKTTTERMLSSYDIQKSDAKGKYIIKKLFQAYYSTPQQLPNHCVFEYLEYTDSNKYSKKQIDADIEKYGIGKLRGEFLTCIKNKQPSISDKLMLMRVICDYISGMTDAFANKMYQELYG